MKSILKLPLAGCLRIAANSFIYEILSNYNGHNYSNLYFDLGGWFQIYENIAGYPYLSVGVNINLGNLLKKKTSKVYH